MRETKAGIATGIGGVGMGGLMTAADQLDWDFPAEVMWVLAILSIIGLFVSGAIWVHLGYEWYQRQRGKLMSGAVGLLLIGIFLAVSGGFLAWKGGQSAFAIYQTKEEVSTIPSESQTSPTPTPTPSLPQPPSEASPAPSQAPVLPRAIPPTPKPEPPPKSLAGAPSYPSPPPPKPAFDLGEAQGTVRALWQTWLNEKLTSGGGATTEEVSGLVLPPDDWMNERLTRLGRPYRVRARGSQFDILAVEIKDAGTN